MTEVGDIPDETWDDEGYKNDRMLSQRLLSYLDKLETFLNRAGHDS